MYSEKQDLLFTEPVFQTLVTGKYIEHCNGKTLKAMGGPPEISMPSTRRLALPDGQTVPASWIMKSHQESSSPRSLCACNIDCMVRYSPFLGSSVRKTPYKNGTRMEVTDMVHV